MRNKAERKTNIWVRLKLFVILGIMLCCIYDISSYLFNSYHNKKLNEDMRELYEIGPVDIEEIENGYKEDENNESEAKVKDDKLSNLKALQEINDDVIGWIRITDTNIDYPVVKGVDNEYYLKHNVRKESSQSGSIFMDYRNQGGNRDLNTIIYGHNMRDGSMFEELTNYKKKDFFIEHPIIELTTLDGQTQWQIFSVYISNTNFNYIKTAFSNDEEYLDFLTELKEKALYDTDVDITGEDIILTLSTCTYEFNDARFVIHAKLLE